MPPQQPKPPEYLLRGELSSGELQRLKSVVWGMGATIVPIPGTSPEPQRPVRSSERLRQLPTFPDPETTGGYPFDWRGEGFLKTLGNQAILDAYRAEHPKKEIPEKYKELLRKLNER